MSYYPRHPTLIEQNTFDSNDSGTGGAICVHYGGEEIVIRGNVFTNNFSNGGGAIWLEGSNALILNNVMTNNRVGAQGGAIYSAFASSPVIANNVIANNSSDSWGGGISVYSGYPSIVNNTIVGNSARYGGGINIYGGAGPTIANNIVAFNNSGVYYWVGTGDNTTLLLNNNVYANTDYDFLGLIPGASDFSLDPGLVNVVAGDFHLLPGSPCIDAGDDNALTLGWTDMDGQQRLIGPHVDVGADEFDGIPPTVTATNPSHGQTGIPLDITIQVYFSETIRSGPYIGGVSLRKGKSSVANTVSVVENKLLLDPNTFLSKNSTYTVTVPAGAVTDTAGNLLTTPISFSFSTLRK